MTLTRCPICDIERAQITPLESFMLGIGIRKALDDSRSIAEQMCNDHRVPLTMAIVSLAQKMAGLT